LSRYTHKGPSSPQRDPPMAPEERARMVRRALSAYLDNEVSLTEWCRRFPGHIRSEAIANIPPSMRRRGTT